MQSLKEKRGTIDQFRLIINHRLKLGNLIWHVTTLGSKNKTTADKIEKVKIFLQAAKSYDWITEELSVSKQTVASIKKTLPNLNIKQEWAL